MATYLCEKLISIKHSNNLLLLPASLRQQMFRCDTALNPLRKKKKNKDRCSFIRENNLLSKHYLIMKEY